MTDSAHPHSDQLDPWGLCEVCLAADHTHGSTHTFFHAWRAEAVMCHGRPATGTALFAAPLDLRDLAASGWRYDLQQLRERAGSPRAERATFAWRATNAPGTPDPLAAALGQVQAWLAANDWEQDPLNPTRFHK